jgi:HSP20 family protein
MKEQRLQRWDPFAPALWGNPYGILRQLTGEMERFFESPTSRIAGEARPIEGAAWSPSLDVFEKDGTLVVRADLPGLTKDEVQVEVTDEAITLKGERKKEIEEKKEGFYRLERAYGSFYRAVPLPEGIKPEDVKATFKNGVLEVTAPLPAAKKETKARRVDIQEVAGEKKAKPAA